MTGAQREAFVAAFLREFLQEMLGTHRLGVSQYYSLIEAVQRGKRDLAHLLFKKPGRRLRLPGDLGSVRLIRLRECDGRPFYFIQPLPRAQPAHARKLTCFVGHRFVRGVERSLRYNLRQLLEPYGIRLVWSGYDLQAGDVFTDIVRHIRRCSMCIFDNRGTLNKPNVYIEAGIAFALRRPMMVCEYCGPGTKRLETGSVPSDLTGLVRITYRTYAELSRKMYFGLPAFFARNALGRRGPPRARHALV